MPVLHEQAVIKVNCPVDRAVAPLVAALNEFPRVVTVTSCEGDEGEDANVGFHIGDDWHELAEFVRDLSLALSHDGRLADRYYSLSVEWYAGGENPLAYLRV